MQIDGSSAELNASLCVLAHADFLEGRAARLGWLRPAGSWTSRDLAVLSPPRSLAERISVDSTLSSERRLFGISGKQASFGLRWQAKAVQMQA